MTHCGLGDSRSFMETSLMPARPPLGLQKIGCFVGTRDVARAKAFYADTLGLHLVREELPFALIFDAKGTTLRVQMVRELTPAQYTVLGWEVADIVAAAKDLQQAGVKLERFDGIEQDEFGIWTAPGGAAKVAWFKDPEGNILGIAQH
jgi:catechol 2,3-dioxygenase-like lactoylglutathione lyase family enzyme